MSINAVFLSGNLTRDPELRTTDEGKSVVSFDLATNEGNGRAEYHRCTAWEERADLIAKYCKKGNRVALQGKLSTNRYEKEGVKRYSTEIKVLNIDLPPKGAGDSADDPDEDLPPATQAAHVDAPTGEVVF